MRGGLLRAALLSVAAAPVTASEACVDPNDGSTITVDFAASGQTDTIFNNLGNFGPDPFNNAMAARVGSGCVAGTGCFTLGGSIDAQPDDSIRYANIARGSFALSSDPTTCNSEALFYSQVFNNPDLACGDQVDFIMDAEIVNTSAYQANSPSNNGITDNGDGLHAFGKINVENGYGLDFTVKFRQSCCLPTDPGTGASLTDCSLYYCSDFDDSYNGQYRTCSDADLTEHGVTYANAAAKKKALYACPFMSYFSLQQAMTTGSLQGSAFSVKTSIYDLDTSVQSGVAGVDYAVEELTAKCYSSVEYAPYSFFSGTVPTLNGVGETPPTDWTLEVMSEVTHASSSAECGDAPTGTTLKTSTFRSTVEGFGSDNPADPTTLNQFQSKVSITIVNPLPADGNIHFRYDPVGGGQAGRNLMISGAASQVLCPSPSPPPPVYVKLDTDGECQGWSTPASGSSTEECWALCSQSDKCGATTFFHSSGNLCARPRLAAQSLTPALRPVRICSSGPPAPFGRLAALSVLDGLLCCQPHLRKLIQLRLQQQLGEHRLQLVRGRFLADRIRTMGRPLLHARLPAVAAAAAHTVAAAVATVAVSQYLRRHALVCLRRLLR